MNHTMTTDARAVAADSAAALTVARVLPAGPGTFAVHGSAELIIARDRQLSSDDARPCRECC